MVTKKYLPFNVLVQSIEQFLSYYYGFKIKLKAQITGEFDKENIINDCRNVIKIVEKIFADNNINSDFPEYDKYYFALKICLDKYPFMTDELLSEVFNKKNRTTITKAKVKIEDFLHNDINFKANFTKVYDLIN